MKQLIEGFEWCCTEHTIAIILTIIIIAVIDAEGRY